MAFSLEANGKKVVYSTDNELDLRLKNRDATMENLTLFRESLMISLRSVKMPIC